MSGDEQMAVIGRMVTGRKNLQERLAALENEADRFGKGLERIGRIVSNYRSPYYAVELPIEQHEFELLNAEKIKQLVNDILETQKQIQELNERLGKAGL